MKPLNTNPKNTALLGRLLCGSLLSASLLCTATPTLAQNPAEPPAPAIPTNKSFTLDVSGYGELRFAYHDFGPDQTRPGGARNDHRLVFEQSRFVTKIEGAMPYGFGFEAEIEFEYGGTGTALELEYEEFGEYDREVEKGGEVLVEELYLSKDIGDWLTLKLGRFYVAMGLLSQHSRPTDYLAGRRSESETMVLPAVWDEMGLSAEATFGPVKITAQVINGLDSTGFSSQRWIALGHQRRFELVRASDLAGVLRADVNILEGLTVGASVYYGNTTRNRPKPDMAAACADNSNDRQRDVAPCGYVSAPLLLVDAHLHLDKGPVRASAVGLWGKLENAAEISRMNKRLSNQLGSLRSEVADQAMFVWAELGLDVATWLPVASGHRIEPFVRFDHYNTMFETAPEIAQNPRFERNVWTAGISYTLLDALVTKLDFSHRTFGTENLNSENTLELMAGFVY